MNLAEELREAAGWFAAHQIDAPANWCVVCYLRWPCSEAEARDVMLRAADALDPPAQPSVADIIRPTK